jgi:hypothetical protein
MNSPVRVICFTILLSAFSFRAGAENFTNAIHAFLQHRGDLERTEGAIVVGIVDDHGSSVISYGKLDIFKKHWALALLNEVLNRLEDECRNFSPRTEGVTCGGHPGRRHFFASPYPPTGHTAAFLKSPLVCCRIFRCRTSCRCAA